MARASATSHRGVTVAPMSSHSMAGPRPALHLERRAERRGTFVRVGAVFHNSSITSSVSGGVGTCHQDFCNSTPNLPRAVVEQRPQAKFALGSHAKAQCSPEDSTTSRHCLSPRFAHREGFAEQPFQGGGTGSNPVGGARRPPWSERASTLARLGPATTSLPSCITSPFPGRPRRSHTCDE